MGRVIVRLLPLIIGAAVGAPAWIIMSLILLRSKRGVIKATAFAAGAVMVRTLQFVLFGYVFGVAIDTGGQEAFDLIPPTLLLVAGLLLLINAARTWLRKDEDSDAPPPRWMTILGGVSALTAFGMAVVLMAIGVKQWVFTLSAIAVIDDAHLGREGSIVAYLFFIIAAHSLMLAPIISSAAAPAQSAKMVEATLRWLERNHRTVTIVISLVFGTWLLARSTTSLMAHAGESPINKAPTTN